MIIKESVSNLDCKRVALYVRVSKEEQALRGYSLPAQKAALEKFAKENGMKIVDMYADEGVTARKKLHLRKEFQRLLSDVRRNEIDMIIFIRLDRWFRNVADYHNTQKVLDDHKVEWKAIFEHYDTTTIEGQYFITVKMANAQQEADLTSARIKDVVENKISNGELVSGTLPMGYLNIDKKAVIDESTKHIVIDAFQHFDLYGSIRKTMFYISEKYPDHQLSYRAARRLLKNELYVGKKRDNESFCAGIIDPYLFYQVQKKLENNKKHRKNSYIHVFSTLLWCNTCGLKMSANASKHPNKVYIFYRCNNSAMEKKCTHKNKISLANLEKLMLVKIKEFASEYIASYEIVATEKNNNKQAVSRLNDKLVKFKNLYMNDYISFEEFKNETDDIKNQIASLSTKAKKKDLSPLKSFLNLDLESFYYTLNDAEKQAFWSGIVEQIWLDDDNNIVKIIFL